MTNILRRMFSTKRNKALAGIRKRINIIEHNKLIDKLEELDAQDISEYEADFMTIAESHKMHERETIRKKEQLKQKIVIKKYFKEKEPRFLTFAEKELIRTLHESNPEKWPVERLSESFPALPDTIYKILHVKWSPRSVESIIRYDNVVVENWEKFHSGKLSVNPILNKHLLKFKDRKIILTDRKLLAQQFIPPKLEFKKPTSQLFSKIVQTYLDEKQNNTELSQRNDSNKELDISNYSDKNQNLFIADKITKIDTSPITTTATVNSEKYMLNKKYLVLKSQMDLKECNMPYNKNNIEQPLTFNEFVKIKLKDIHKESLEEGDTLLNVYKQQVNNNQEMQTSKTDTAVDNAVMCAEKDSVITENEDCDSDIVAVDNLIDTHIKVWNKKVDTECSYANPIKIMKHVYKRGMTYRIGDCYYNDDGEFLYRVPGIHS